MTRASQSPPLDFETIDDVLAAMRAAGHRITQPRRQVLQALFDAPGPVSAEHLAGDTDLASVYRALEQFEQLGVARHVHAGHGPGLYALVGHGEREYLACERCGTVLAVDPRQLDAVRAEIAATFGFEARFTHFPIVGRCADCTGR